MSHDLSSNTYTMAYVSPLKLIGICIDGCSSYASYMHLRCRYIEILNLQGISFCYIHEFDCIVNIFECSEIY